MSGIAVRLHRTWTTAVACGLGGLLLGTGLLLAYLDHCGRTAMRDELLEELGQQADDLGLAVLERFDGLVDREAVLTLADHLDGTVAGIAVFAPDGSLLRAPRHQPDLTRLADPAIVAGWWRDWQLQPDGDRRLDNFPLIRAASGFPETAVRLRARSVPAARAVVVCGRTLSSAKARFAWLEADSRTRLLIALGFIVGLFAVAWFVSGTLLRRHLQRTVAEPLTRLAAGTAELGAGRLEHRVPTVPGPSEIMRLGEAFNGMAVNLERTSGELHALHATLEQQVAARTAELTTANRELESFSYTVSHDLRAPLRSINGFASILLEDHPERMAGEPAALLDRIRVAVRRMEDLIEALLRLARFSRVAMAPREVDVSATARRVLDELSAAHPERTVAIDIAPGIAVRADQGLLDVVLENLLGNAWKYSARKDAARIAVAPFASPGRRGFRVSDDGAGFDMAYAGKLFEPFNRLHAVHEFEGTGIGLATVARIVQRHNGTIRAESSPGRGAAFTVELPDA